MDSSYTELKLLTSGNGICCGFCLQRVQQHIPFRESKLTHFLQGFFSGKGKIHMLVNISQCASACDETFNVLRFSAIAQKVSVLKSILLIGTYVLHLKKKFCHFQEYESSYIL